MSYTTVISAVSDWWAATPAAQELTTDGRLWLDQAPEETPLPYATIVGVSEIAEVWTTNYPIVRAVVQIALHGDTAVEAGALLGEVTALLGKSSDLPAGAALSVAGSAVMHVIQGDFSVHVGQGLGPDGQDCWVAIQLFDVVYTP